MVFKNLTTNQIFIIIKLLKSFNTKKFIIKKKFYKRNVLVILVLLLFVKSCFKFL